MKKEIINQVVLSVIVALIVLIILSLFGVFKNNIITPTNAVLAFKKEKCPSGWDELDRAKGRMIIGAGQGDRLNNRKFNTIGGNETDTALPKHSHSFIDTYVAHSDNHKKPTITRGTGLKGIKFEGSYKGASILSAKKQTHEQSNLKKDNNMSPYLALTYCIKK